MEGLLGCVVGTLNLFFFNLWMARVWLWEGKKKPYPGTLYVSQTQMIPDTATVMRYLFAKVSIKCKT
jgi:hypothetical protein